MQVAAEMDGIIRRLVEGPWRTDANIGEPRGGQRLGLWHDLALGKRRPLSDAVIRQVVALIDIEHGISAQKWNGRLFLCGLFLTCGARAALLALGNEAIGITDGDTVFALAHGVQPDPIDNGVTSPQRTPRVEASRPASCWTFVSVERYRLSPQAEPTIPHRFRWP